MKKIKDWVNNTSVYPPGHIYAGQPQGKQEKLAVTACEDLYKFNHGNKPNVLGELRASWRELEVTMKMAESDSERIFVLPEYFSKVIGEFLYWANRSVKSMDDCFKKHQAVNAYYSSWKMKTKEINQIVYDSFNKEIYFDAIQHYDNKVKAE